MQRIFLTGLSGAGKTTVGAIAASILGWRLLDTDALIEQQDGRSVTQIFREDGERYFRQRESEALRRAAAQEQVVVATGGGAVISEANRALLRQQGFVAHLAVPVETAWQRLQEHAASERPLLAGGSGQQK